MIAAVLGTFVLLAPATPRERIRFDADWRFNRVPIAAREGGFEWSYRVAPDVTSLDAPLPGDLAGSDWKTVQTGDYVLKPKQYAWYKAELGPDPAGVEKVLDFESIDEDAAIFLNGKPIGKHIGFGTEFQVPVRDAWSPSGPNSLVVLVWNSSGGGGIAGPVTLVRPEAGELPPEVAPGFDDKAWRTVHLPHDYVVEGTFDPKGDNSHGSLPKPIGFYRKSFTPPESMRGKSVWIDFDGVYRNSDVYLNGQLLGHQNSGYVGFRYDLSQKLEYGKPNVIAVRVDPRKNEGWWYEGGGIYRHVWLNAASPVHIAPNSLFARASLDNAVAEVKVDVTVADDGASTPVDVHSDILDPSGKLVGGLDAKNVSLAAGGTVNVAGSLRVTNPQLWDLDSPDLYQVVTTIRQGGKPVDTQTASFGIRTLAWDKEQGFLLNGRVVKLKGTCNHQDHAGAGIALSDGLMEWRVKTLLAMGSNAYRTSHNPVAPELLDACDRLGMLVLDETRHLGDTSAPKSGPGTPADDLGELKSQIMRDRNHPSIIAWSVYNEEPLQGTPEGASIFTKMRAVADELDGTRVCTGATNFGYDQGIIDVTKLFGFNYNIGQYDPVHAKRPELPLFGSETASAVSTRGIYANDPVRGYVSAYDVNAPSWGATAEAAWKAVGERPWMAGAFVWTGFDYKGEPTPYGWPCINSHFGILDIAGFPKDSYWYYKSWWGTEPIVHLLPHWNWPGKEGQTVKVWAYSNADRVELFLNGKSLGEKDVPKLGHIEWDVAYAPGTLEARAVKGGKKVAEDRVETTGEPVALRLSTDRRKLLADGEDVSVVKVEVVDAKDRVCPIASNEVKFTIEGAAALGGVGNGDPSDHDPDKADHRKAFNGLCMALIQSNGGKGRITLRATSSGLKEDSLSLDASGGMVSR